MNQWSVEPADWKDLTPRQQKRMFKKGLRIATRLMLTLVVFSLVVEFVTETFL